MDSQRGHHVRPLRADSRAPHALLPLRLVTCNVRGRDLGAVARDVEARLAALPFERGYYAEVLGEEADRED